MSIHFHYDQLDDDEKRVVDELLRTAFTVSGAVLGPGKLACDVRAERAADALARWIIESRGKRLTAGAKKLLAGVNRKDVGAY
jgi:hypothetical protein